MKVICKHHKICSLVECLHKKTHKINSYEGSGCVTLQDSGCFCGENKQYIRKEKLKKLSK